MINRDKEIAVAQEQVNRCRDENNCLLSHNKKTGRLEPTRKTPRDKGYMPRAEGFVTVEWDSGFMTIAEDAFLKMSKAARNKILRLGNES